MAYRSVDDLPVLATIAPPDGYYIPSEPVLGFPMYDHVGCVLHKQHHLFWRKRQLAIQGRHLLYFDEPNLADPLSPIGEPKFVLDLSRIGDVEVSVDDNGSLVKIGNRNEWRWRTTEFSLVGPGLPDGKPMIFQTETPEECKKWCGALRLALHGRCRRCTVVPAKQPGQKYCAECVAARKKERLQERLRQASAMGFQGFSSPGSLDSSGSPLTTTSYQFAEDLGAMVDAMDGSTGFYETVESPYFLPQLHVAPRLLSPVSPASQPSSDALTFGSVTPGRQTSESFSETVRFPRLDSTNPSDDLEIITP